MYQSRFRTSHSTNFCLTQLTDLISTGMDKQMHPGMILVDLQKAFDTLDHRVLLERMKYLVSGHLYLNFLSPISQIENFLVFINV